MKKMSLKKKIAQGMMKMYEGQIAQAAANVEIYLSNPAGIGEHSEVLDAIDEQISKIAEAEEKLSVLIRIAGGR